MAVAGRLMEMAKECERVGGVNILSSQGSHWGRGDAIHARARGGWTFCEIVCDTTRPQLGSAQCRARVEIPRSHGRCGAVDCGLSSEGTTQSISEVKKLRHQHQAFPDLSLSS